MRLVQFANLFIDGAKVKMSTRSGDFYSLGDLIKEIGSDAARFFYLSKQSDQHLDFDIDLAKSDNKENIFIIFNMRMQESFLWKKNTMKAIRQKMLINLISIIVTPNAIN